MVFSVAGVTVGMENLKNEITETGWSTGNYMCCMSFLCVEAKLDFTLNRKAFSFFPLCMLIQFN